MFRSWRLFAFIGVLVLILLGPLLYSVFRTKGDKLLLQPMKLEWWRMADAPEDLNAIIVYDEKEDEKIVDLVYLLP